MTQTMEAIYENSILKPLTPIRGFFEHQRVEVTVSSTEKKRNLHSLIGTLTKEEAEEMQRSIDEEFEKIDE